MTHEMNLCDAPFTAIKSGLKTVEMRLNDEKRRLLKKGDTILFTNQTTGERLTAYVKNIVPFCDFFELYKHYDKSQIGYKKCEAANPEDMYLYYPKEKIQTYGVLAIEISLVN